MRVEDVYAGIAALIVWLFFNWLILGGTLGTAIDKSLDALGVPNDTGSIARHD